jgi:poly-gamma-glutamate synthesis protein (capsule biosynthesis protein)
LPQALRDPVTNLEHLNDRPVDIVENADESHVRVEPWPEVTLSEWFFALVAAFPTITDSVSMDELVETWKGDTNQQETLYLPLEDAHIIAEIFEDDPGIAVLQTTDSFLHRLWQDRQAIGILPFESLHPQLKVLQVNGLSPIHNDFISENYPLKVDFGLSGDPESVQLVMDSIQWPSSNRDPNRLTVLLMTGVTALTRATAWTMENKGLEYPAEKIMDWLLGADLTHISNEVSFYDDCPAPTPVREGLIFCSNPKYVELLEAIDVDMIELTGNHLKDHGEESLAMTLDIYAQHGWGIFGGGMDLEEAFQPLLIEHHGNKLAFLGCNSAGPGSVFARDNEPGATPCNYERLFQELNRLKAEGYMTIFTFQWNEYYRATPSTEQVEDFQAAIDAGAMIVNGSQAHQPQAFEFYGDGFIHYGLGNLFFDQMWAIAVRQEFLDRHVFYDGKHISTELLTAFLEDFAQPRPMTEEERKFFLQEIFTASGW